MSNPNHTPPLLPTAIPPPPPPPFFFSQAFSNLGLGYAIAIACGFLVLLSSLILSSYLCLRRFRFHLHHASVSSSATPPLRHPVTPDGGIILPRIIFVAEEDDPADDNARNGSTTGVVGLTQAVINSYPKFQFDKSSLAAGAGENRCSICLCEYREGETVRMMPDCKHVFHLVCLDAWLKLNGSCPVCRSSPMPTPMSTPLAEVVPLAQYGDNRWRS